MTADPWRRLCLALLATTAAIPILRAAGDPIQAYVASLADSLDPRAVATLTSIEGEGRQLLAARAYLRSGNGLAERWSWTEAQSDAFRRSADGLALQEAISAVRCRFEAANPGYTLFVNPAFRNLERQIERWNHNASVSAAGEELLQAIRKELDRPDAPDPFSEAGRRRIRQLLLDHRPAPTPSLAAPGLSPHGQLRAIDFQVQQAGRIIAGTSTTSIQATWVADGWSRRLQVAVHAADRGFSGPLASPDEPWHYQWQAVDIGAQARGEALPKEQCSG